MPPSRCASPRSRRPRERRLELIDIRSAEEFAAAPTPARHIPMPALLADPKLLLPGIEYLFICASGKRSLAAARALRQSGLRVQSLAGGLQALAPPIASMRFESKLPDVGTTIFTVMSRRAQEEGALNIGQGFPDYPIDPRLGQSLIETIGEGRNQYAPMEGVIGAARADCAQDPCELCRPRRSAGGNHRHLRRHRGLVRCDSSRDRPGR